jgi:predicted esterase YcpF (UPF0227 family)
MFKNVLYIHGIGSTGGGSTVTMFKKAFPNVNIYSPEIPTMPKEAFEFIHKFVKNNNIDFVIGTSLGGFYAMMISGIPKLLVNPAMYANKDIVNAIGYGVHEYLRLRESGETTYNIDDTYTEELTFLANRYYSEWKDDEYVYETRAIFGTEDELLDHIEDFKKEFNEANMRTANFGHRMTKEVFNTVFIPFVNDIYNEVTTKKTPKNIIAVMNINKRKINNCFFKFSFIFIPQLTP